MTDRIKEIEEENAELKRQVDVERSIRNTEKKLLEEVAKNAELKRELVRWKAVSPDRCDLEYIELLEKDNRRLETELTKAREENAELRRERDEAISELRTHRPFADAYKRVCESLGIEKDILGFFQQKEAELADARRRLEEFKGVVNDIDRCGECWKSSWCPQCEYTLREAIVKLFDAQQAIKKVGEDSKGE
jgi:hypothetical protein